MPRQRPARLRGLQPSPRPHPVQGLRLPVGCTGQRPGGRWEPLGMRGSGGTCPCPVGGRGRPLAMSRPDGVVGTALLGTTGNS